MTEERRARIVSLVSLIASFIAVVCLVIRKMT